jgi:hypothetical protein
LDQLSEASCRAGRQRRCTMWGSARRSDGCSGCVGRAVSLPGKIGGYRPRKLVGPWRIWLLERCRNGEFTLRGLVAELAERGLRVDYRVVWAFVHAEKLSHKKRR